MRQATALTIKLIFTSAIFATTLPLLGLTFIAHALIMAAVTCLLLWIVGDLVILPLFGNLAATAADGVTTLLALPAIASKMGTLVMPPGLFAAAGLLAVAEWFFHRWLIRHDILC